jgi:histidinol-phosphate aminotransferase
MERRFSSPIDRRNALRFAGATATTVGLGVYRPKAAYAAESGGPARLLANENPYGPAKSAQEAMALALADGWMYATGEARVLRDLIAAKEGVSSEHILITAGSGELLRMAGLSFGQTGEIVAAKPTFSMLTAYARDTGGTVHEVLLDSNMCHDLAAMEARVTDKTSLVYVCNPNNPTGTLLEPDELRRFVETVESRATVFIDEAYVELLPDQNLYAMVDQIKADKNVVIGRTFSKIHGMAGLRIGYAIARPDLISRLRPLQMSFLNIMGLRAAAASYQDIEFQEYSRARIRECVSVTESAMDDLGLPYTPTAANFVLFDTGGSVREFAAAMRAKKLMVGRSYAPYETWCRVSMGTVGQMERFAEALRDYYKG